MQLVDEITTVYWKAPQNVSFRVPITVYLRKSFGRPRCDQIANNEQAPFVLYAIYCESSVRVPRNVQNIGKTNKQHKDIRSAKESSLLALEACTF